MALLLSALPLLRSGLVSVGLRFVPCAPFVCLRRRLLDTVDLDGLLGECTARVMPACRVRSRDRPTYMPVLAGVSRMAACLASMACSLLRCDDGAIAGISMALSTVPCRSGRLHVAMGLDERWR